MIILYGKPIREFTNSENAVSIFTIKFENLIIAEKKIQEFH